MTRVVAWVALIVAVAACVFSVHAAAEARSDKQIDAIEQRVYERLVAETWNEVAPVYKDFHMDVSTPPKTITELLRPLLSVESVLAPGGTEHESGN